MLGDYNADPEIAKVPEPDLSVIASFDPKKDEAKAIEMNYTLYDTRMTSSKSAGGAVTKARNIKDQEDSVRSSLDLMYKDLKQKQKAYEASETLSMRRQRPIKRLLTGRMSWDVEPSGIPSGRVCMAFQ